MPIQQQQGPPQQRGGPVGMGPGITPNRPMSGGGGQPPPQQQQMPINGPAPTPAQIQKILDENSGLIQTIQDFQNMGKLQECMSYQHALHKNLVYLASLADASQNFVQILPVSLPSPKNVPT